MLMIRQIFSVAALVCAVCVTSLAQGRSASLGVDPFAGTFLSESAAPIEPFSLWYRRPAANWDEALPIGNGRLAAMIFGGITGERIQLNEDTLWAGSPYDPVNPSALGALTEARNLVFAGKYTDAARLINQKMMSVPLKQMPYQPISDLRLAFPDADGVSGYRRELDIRNAIARVTYKIGDTTFTREMFSTAPDGVIVIRITADRKNSISISGAFQSPQESVAAVEKGDTLVLSGRNGSFRGIEGKLRFQSRARFLREGGRLTNKCPGSATLAKPYSLSNEGRDTSYREKALSVDANNCVAIENANSVTILISAATSYVDFENINGDEVSKSRRPIAVAEKRSFETIRRAHIADYRKFFDRVTLDLGSAAAVQNPTDERIKNFAKTEDPQLVSLYFQYGRYLLIASSRPGTQPATLQGIWNDSMTPPWDSKYTININTEMNYWPAEPTNLSEMTEPLVRMVGEMSKTGARTARKMYDAGGWVAHHNTDLWRATGPIDAANYGMWQTGGAWLTTHLWEHYEYTLDRAFLERSYPVMKGASEFFLDFLVTKPGTSYLVTNPSLSPENSHPFGTSVVDAPMMDSQIIRDLFESTEKAAATLGRDAEFAKRLEVAREKLPPNRIGRAGQLQEWFEDWDEQAKDPRHRHVSHLYAAFPSWQISRRDTPNFADAVRTTLDKRGDETTGWAIAWRLNLWARLGDRERVYKILALLLRPERTYPNMFDAHPPFQIDGNFGGANGIAEMLVQNRVRDDIVEIDLLPALPSKFANGRITGIRARHGVEVDAEWKNGRLVSAVFRAKNHVKVRVLYRSETKELNIKKGLRAVFRPST